MEVALLLVAGAFAVLNGVNDGGTLLATTLKMSTLRPLAAATTLVAGVTVAPAIAGTRVATTLSERLVSFSGTDGPIAMLLAVLSATVVVIGLSWRGFPTSLTVALVGGIVGVGVGASLPISWRSISVVLIVAALAPLAGFAGGLALSRLWQHAPSWFRVGDQVRHAHRLGFLLQTLAYGTNDGQKMLGVFAVALPMGVSDGGVVPMWPVLLTIGALFAVGIPAGIQRIGTRIGSDVLPVTPVQAVTTQFSSAAAVLASSAVGAPVSMTQSIAGGIVGSGFIERRGRVRWNHVFGVVLAWLLTLPMTAAVAALISFLVLRVFEVGG